MILLYDELGAIAGKGILIMFFYTTLTLLSGFTLTLYFKKDLKIGLILNVVFWLIALFLALSIDMFELLGFLPISSFLIIQTIKYLATARG